MSYNNNMILGIDEVGRGPWAGPLVVGAVVLGGVTIDGLTDSKKLTKKRREALAPVIKEQAAAWALGWVTANELDAIGMSEALRLATRRAVEQIKVPYSEIIIDGTINFLSDTGKGKYVTCLPKADLLVPSVSAASVLAKVARDDYMSEQDEAYPGYNFEAHAGYGVAAHRQAIELLGVTPLHRLSFAPLQKYKRDDDGSEPSATIASTARRAKSSFISRVAAGLATHSSQPEMTATVAGLGRATATDNFGHQTTRKIGNESEEVVADYLKVNGHELVERNWRTKWCEVDIISHKNGTLYFTEVKHRKNDKAGDGFDAITPKKLQQMTFAAELYAASKPGYDLQLAVAKTTGEPPALSGFLVIE